MEEMNNEMEQEQINDFIENNPLLKLAKERCKQEDKMVDTHVEEILNLIKEKVESEQISIKTAILALSKSIGYCCQGYMKNEEEFFSEKEIANKLVINNLYPALGAYHDNPEINKNGTVEFKGEFDKDNFNFKRLILTAIAMIEYSNWKIHLAQASSELEKKYKEQ